MEEQTIISGPPEAFAAERTQIAMAPGVDVTQAAIVIECPVCHTANPPGDRWCQDCGFLLTSQAPEALELPAASGPRLVLDGREFELHAGANTIGRVGADVLLPDPTVSRHHATLTIDEEGAWIEDVGSTNGTSVNGAPVPAGDRSRIQNGDTLKLGTVTVKLLWPDQAAGGPLPPAPEEISRLSITAAVALLIAADGTEYALRPGVTSIGRRAENVIALSGDAYVSGRHAEIRCEQPHEELSGGCVLVDVGSTNGSFLRRQPGGEEERLRPHDPQPLTPGDQIRLGQTAFTFQAAGPEADEGEAITEEAQDADATADGAAGEPPAKVPGETGGAEPLEV
jgi:pSer/pThr/pTyr-binding forkhead associated (FHA) protein